MRAKSSYNKQGIVNRIDVKLTKRDMLKVFAMIFGAYVLAEIPVGAIRRSTMNKAIEKTGDKLDEHIDARVQAQWQKMVDDEA